jgi:predicted nucleic acid-binding protein
VKLVDSSVWIAHLRGDQAEATTKLLEAITRNQVLVGDLILLEILRGARDEAHAARIAWGLRKYAVVPLLDPNLAILAARSRCRMKLSSLGKFSPNGVAHISPRPRSEACPCFPTMM